MEGELKLENDKGSTSSSVELKRSWRNRTMSSLNSPPLALLALFGVVVFYLYLSTYFPYKESLHRASFSLKLILLALPALLIFMMRTNYNSSDSGSSKGWYWVRIPKPEHDSFHRVGGSPWGVALVVVLLLVMISYHSSVGSHWFRPLWYHHYY
ncbi:uncharacterized protein LOC110733204 [Chenopodium quinoa]|uniref:uncharacterized protein LOC110733204 n=1 Tax=Chenopodium quinoa TaxID=63459 RepID=UPI000B777CC7|nr:uncharacterized protein LOC110733204 [Chenopodium quinoa]